MVSKQNLNCGNDDKAKYDDGLGWLREIRRKMAAKFEHDPRKAAAYYQEMQKRYSDRLYRCVRTKNSKSGG